MNRKRILAWVLALIMTVALLPAAVFADETAVEPADAQQVIADETEADKAEEELITDPQDEEEAAPDAEIQEDEESIVLATEESSTHSINVTVLNEEGGLTSMYAMGNAVVTEQADGTFLIRMHQNNTNRNYMAFVEDTTTPSLEAVGNHEVDWYVAGGDDGYWYVVKVDTLDDVILARFSSDERVAAGRAWSNVMTITFDKNSLGETDAADVTEDEITILPAEVPTPRVELNDGTYLLPELCAGPSAMFNHFEADSRYLIVEGDNATIRFITDGSTASIAKYSKIALGKSSELVQTAYQPTLPDGVTVIEGNKRATEGTSGARYLFEITLPKSELETLLANDIDEDIYITVWNNQGTSSNGYTPGWYMASNDIYLNLGILGEAAEIPSDIETTELAITNNTTMFKAVSAHLEIADGATTLVMALSGTGYKELYKGTYEAAVANGDGSADKGNDSWIHATTNDAGKYEFRIPIAEGESYVPVVAVSDSYYNKYVNGQNSLARAFYPRQFELDTEAKTLVTGDYEFSQDLAVTNNVKMFKVSAASLDTVGGPNSNNYKANLELTMGSDSFDKAFVGSSEEAAVAASVIEIGEGRLFSVPVKWVKSFGNPETLESLVGEEFIMSFHSVLKDEWYERAFVINEADGTLTINEVDNTLSIVKQPENTKKAAGETISYTVEAKNAVSYQWYYTKNGTKWYKSAADGADTATVSFTVKSNNRDNQYRCTLTGKDGATLDTDTVKNEIADEALKVTGITVTGESASQTITVTADNAASYQLYYSKDGSKWYKSTLEAAVAEDNSSVSYEIALKSSNMNNLYRCTVTGTDGTTAKSDEVSLNGVPKITEDPADVSASAGDTVTFSVKAEGASYQWYYSKDGGEKWYKSSAEGAAGASMSLKAKASNNGMMYRCKVTGESGLSVNSEAATLTVS